jgi:hypothetical protein
VGRWGWKKQVIQLFDKHGPELWPDGPVPSWLKSLHDKQYPKTLFFSDINDRATLVTPQLLSFLAMLISSPVLSSAYSPLSNRKPRNTTRDRKENPRLFVAFTRAATFTLRQSQNRPTTTRLTRIPVSPTISHGATNARQ